MGLFYLIHPNKWGVREVAIYSVPAPPWAVVRILTKFSCVAKTTGFAAYIATELFTGSTLRRLQAQFLNAYSTLPCPPLPRFAAEIGVCHRAHSRSAAALPDLMPLSLFRP
jgi:hypothetical protein